MKKSVPSIHKVGLNYGFGNFTSLPLHIYPVSRILARLYRTLRHPQSSPYSFCLSDPSVSFSRARPRSGSEGSAYPPDRFGGLQLIIQTLPNR